MRIDGRHTILQAYGNKMAEPGAAAPREDALGLSQRAMEIEQVKQRLVGLPEVREARVAEARARLERGELDISSNVLADCILESGVMDLPEGWRD